MPSSATPSPLDQLAGIDDVLSYARIALAGELAAARDEGRREDARTWNDALQGMWALSATLATLREELAGVTEQRIADVEDAARMCVHSATAGRLFDLANTLRALRTPPDSPRQAGEEITDG